MVVFAAISATLKAQALVYVVPATKTGFRVYGIADVVGLMHYSHHL